MKEEERVRKEEERKKKGKAAQGKEKVKESLQGGAGKSGAEDDGQEGECAYTGYFYCSTRLKKLLLIVTPEMDHLRCMMYIPGE